MQYDAKPWLRSYDAGVPETVEARETPFSDYFDEIVSRYPDKPAVHFIGITMTYRELQSQANRIAQALMDNGCGPGDVVGIHLPNIPQYLVTQIAASKAGCAVSGMSPLLAPREIVYQLNDCGAKAVVTLDAIFERRLAGVADEIPNLKLVMVTGIVDYLSAFKRVLARILRKVPYGKTWPLSGKTVMPFSRGLSDYPDRSHRGTSWHGPALPYPVHRRYDRDPQRYGPHPTQHCNKPDPDRSVDTGGAGGRGPSLRIPALSSCRSGNGTFCNSFRFRAGIDTQSAGHGVYGETDGGTQAHHTRECARHSI